MSSPTATAPADATLTIGSESWRLHIFAVTRIGRDLFIQMSVLGPRECTVVVRTDAVVQGVTSRRILDGVCEWLVSGDPARQVLLDLRDRPAHAEAAIAYA